MRDLPGLLVRRIDTGDLHEHPDDAAVVLVVPVGVEEAVGLEPHDVAEHHVLAELARELLERLADRRSLEGQAGDVAVAVRGDQLGDARRRPR